ncbi:hypothetical protein Q428_05965 [Fervidicella metallireducens AeB]|uniref:Uncharacterized protein n=1 Tax=Fervidicella metallireducens AeB TaxID=1403537 RepID=A0A017RWN8_9CLOT|nr:hypothetical protein Q428_05965 [Fervidicella metallireducens AeB]
MIKSTDHGLNADFLKLFDYVYSKVNNEFKKSNLIDLQNHVILETNNGRYVINYSNILPEFKQLKR